MEIIRNSEIEKISEIIKKGGVIVFPTDTVMGIGTYFLNIQGQKKIYHLKKRKLEKPLVIFIRDRNELKKFVAHKKLGILREKIIQNFWPGPLTCIFKSKIKGGFLWIAKNGTVGVRIPNHPLILEILEKTGPLATTSANISENPPVKSYKKIDPFIKREIGYLIPENSYGFPPSTVIDLSEYPFKILRKGPVSIAAIEELILRKVKIDKSISLNILFVCSGNTCRSPMAAGLLRKYLPYYLRKNVKIKSRGVNAVPLTPISENAKRVLEEIGIDLSFHKAKNIDVDTLEWADFIYVMERRHFMEISKYGFSEKIRLISNEMEIPDPFGGGIDEYRKVLKLLEKPVKKIIKEIEWRYEV
ncbi:MAG: L-threonylcarbamoyladenylate synthase [candidate division WOR-3 bacterium]|uniref:L-threonylcarbamoyladenylate synthase n=1 Tax=candidate division WOR-3 bacterium TaxID=2052148 RepID=A0A7V4E2L5_UNCW3